jgi:hypothetical protein
VGSCPLSELAAPLFELQAPLIGNDSAFAALALCFASQRDAPAAQDKWEDAPSVTQTKTPKAYPFRSLGVGDGANGTEWGGRQLPAIRRELC